jgi:hypothetical protein
MIHNHNRQNGMDLKIQPRDVLKNGILQNDIHRIEHKNVFRKGDQQK